MDNFLGRSLWTLFLAVLLCGGLYNNNDRELGNDLGEHQQRFRPDISPSVLPNCFITILVVSLVLDFKYGSHTNYFSYFTGFISIFLHIGVYYLILTPLLPVFHRRVSARVCAMLWLLPNYLYFTLVDVPAPLLVSPISLTILYAVLVIWAIGFMAVLGWHLISHLRFRRQLLCQAVEVTDPAILALWQKELEFAGLQKMNYRLVSSPTAQTPLSIGLFQRSIRVVLPQRNYTPDDLTLILRHEIIHISREDSGTKFFLVFCSAACWFNPLMWKAMRHSADDLELSCDETVLLNADDTTRHKYADLLLRTAGDERGFTTCLSASAQAMRYRLENVLHPRKRLTGVPVVMAVFYILMMTCGYVAFGYNHISGQELIFGGQEPSGFTLTSVSRFDTEGGYDHSYNCTDEAALTEYLSGLTFCSVTGSYSFSDIDRGVNIRYSTSHGEYRLVLQANSLTLRDESTRQLIGTYFCVDRLDWEVLYSLVVPYPQLDINMSWQGYDSHFNSRLSPPGRILRVSGENTAAGYLPDGVDFVARTCSEDPIARDAMLSFTHELYDGTFEVLVENWERTHSYTVSSGELEYPLQLELTPYFAHYTVWATIVDEMGVIYDTEYRFDIGPLDGFSK